ncbi:Arc family DNA-binding protein [Bacteroidales bacterium OttesenSCG-928-I21]|nr:Arc family DNA-binding protein [Bacteroidales bacterium OttesenSCG-928-I21]
MPKENKNKSFVLRIDEDMMSAIEKWAADEFRSINGQIQYILDQALRKSGRISKKSEKRQ